MRRPKPEPSKTKTSGRPLKGPDPGFKVNSKPKGGGRQGPTAVKPSGTPTAGRR